jgi:hypothetical protein
LSIFAEIDPFSGGKHAKSQDRRQLQKLRTPGGVRPLAHAEIG